MSSPSITQDQIEQLKVDLQDQTLTNWSIANKYGCSYQTVGAYRARLGIPHPGYIQPEADYHERALELFRSGASCADISRELSLSKDVIYSWAARRGLEFRYQGTSLEGIDRGTIRGFMKYFSLRPEHFREVFGRDYSEQAAREAFEELGV